MSEINDISSQPAGHDGSEPRPAVVAIVPAFNEAETVREVIAGLRSSPGIDEIVVVSDGSTDATLAMARSQGVRAFGLARNHGKGFAMWVGVASSEAPILVFVDGDILNLTGDLIERLMEPVISGRAAMNVGVRQRPFLNGFQRRFGPHLSGIRCLRREVFEAVPKEYLAGYRVEVGLNWTCRRLGLAQTSTVFRNLKHRVKEQKQGLVAGLLTRLSMFSVVFTAWLRLKISPPDLEPSVDVGAIKRLQGLETL